MKSLTACKARARLFDLIDEIAATAVYLDHPLITRDPDIARSVGVDTVW